MKKIMVVDDHKDIVESLKKIINKMELGFEKAYDGEEFLSKVESYKPDLVLLDVMMPGLTTKDILKKLKEKKLKKMKIILLTVVRFAEEEKKELMSYNNIVDYITKPFEPEMLRQRVKSYFDGKKTDRKLFQYGKGIHFIKGKDENS